MTASFLRFLAIALVIGTLLPRSLSRTPVPAQYFSEQYVNHDECCSGFWTQRYYSYDADFAGPGHPIFLILGGEGNIEPTTGIFYDLITDYYAPDFGAFILEPEHRFYGESVPPLDRWERTELFTPKQALQDYMRLVRHYQKELGCSLNKTDADYCPVITVGGSYPGWLSAMARLLFPETVDMAYAASAPMKFYSQEVSADAYYDHITKVSEKSMDGCSDNVREALQALNHLMVGLDTDDLEDTAALLGFCNDTMPSYMKSSPQTFAEEINMMIAYTFANDNMGNYPPTNGTRLHKACEIFSDPNKNDLQKASSFIRFHLAGPNDKCADMSRQVPSGPNATISGGDWSGVGGAASGESWDFQTCTLLVEQISMSEDSMFPTRTWTIDWLKKHCENRFGVTPAPHELVDAWGFDDLVGKTNASRILFTNGLNDGWSVGGILEDLSSDLVVVNFPNGAHHSELAYQGEDYDTEDVQLGIQRIQNILTDWLTAITAPSLVAPDQFNVELK